ncbi:uncharacterized protein EV420DRAFT_1645633 [Desarmillaria tabescens]|uniref:Uncharacterized protein n=1 Tax=Armillaria tabescens TaxID=1929756 RepID=A0AA39K414_ARMTA|nr:uncharacterized protein EV420DRAFT_1645633 [Desarmillaria tabescens]KAK0452784.1 hypothetical protein EV420DRAFT_1645633 [Desarmillaria tabescens]
MNDELFKAVHHVELLGWMESDSSTLPMFISLVDHGYSLLTISIHSIHFNNKHVLTLSPIVALFCRLHLEGCSYDDDMLLHLLRSSSWLDMLEVGVPDRCIFTNLSKGSVPTTDMLSSAVGSMLESHLLCTFYYVTEYGVNYLFESPCFRSLVALMTRCLHDLYIRVDHKSFQYVQDLVDHSGSTLQSVDIVTNNWPPLAASMSLDLSGHSVLELLTLGQDSPHLALLIDALLSYRNPSTLRDLTLMIQLKYGYQSNAAWRRLFAVFMDHPWFTKLEKLNIDVFAYTARHVSEPDVIELVVYIWKIFKVPEIGFPIKVAHRLGMHRFD